MNHAIAESMGLPKVLVTLMMEYYDFRPTVEQIAKDYLPRVVPKSLMKILKLDEIIDGAVLSFERAVEYVRSADKTQYPWVTSNDAEKEDAPLEIKSAMINSSCYNNSFVMLFPLMVELIGFGAGYIKVGDVEDADDGDDGFFDTLINFANGKDWITPS